MTAAEARAFLDAHAINKPSFDFFPAAPYIEAFDQTPEGHPDRQTFLEAMWVFLSEGNETEQSIAATFLSKVAMPPALSNRVVELYMRNDLSCSSPIGALLSTGQLSDHAYQQLKALFVANPHAHACFASRFYGREKSTEIWELVLRLARESVSPAVLHQAFYTAWLYDRQAELVPALRQKPEQVLRETVKLGTPPEILTLCGLQP